MIKKLTALLLAAFITGIVPVNAEIADQLQCIKISTPVNMTGDLNDPAWDQTQPAALSLVDTSGPPKQGTTVRFLYDNACLYVRFDCEDTYVWGTKTERDAPIYTEECVELFISPGNSLHQYYEINLSPKNVIFDACILNPRLVPDSKLSFVGLHNYNVSKMKTAVWINGELDQDNKARNWVAVMAIPFTQLIGGLNIPPASGDSWLFNAFRIDAPLNQPVEYQAWHPTGKIDFHRPLFFGKLKFN